MKLVEVECSVCGKPIRFEVYDLNDSPSGERFASFVAHPQAEWYCPFRYPELRASRAEFQELRLAALVV